VPIAHTGSYATKRAKAPRELAGPALALNLQQAPASLRERLADADDRRLPLPAANLATV
jgi:hypothetical protein